MTRDAEPFALTGPGRIPRYVFTFALSVEPIRNNTYRWVNPISGAHEGYIVAEDIVYASTLTGQFLLSRGVK